jgi:methylmalonyl-CoA mutase
MDSSFLDFPSISKATWLEKIAKELKDKPLEDLHWRVSDDLKVAPFGHKDDFPTDTYPVFAGETSWEIDETIQSGTAKAMNEQALSALNGGAESLTFLFDEIPDFAVFSTCFEGIFLDYLKIQFGGKAVAENPSVFFFYLKKLAERNNLQTEQLNGGILFDLTQKTGLLDWRYLADLIAYQKENFPKFKVIEADCRAFHQGTEGVISELAEALAKGNTYLTKLSKLGTPATDINSSIQFTFAIGKSYFLEIAKLRAFRLLWLQILKAWKVPLDLPKIHVTFAEEAYNEADFTNMVRATSMAMSAVIGGADGLTVRSYAEGFEDKTEYPEDFGRRIARNVQHLLKMESGFEQIGDVAAGSYYIETLTNQLATKAWEAFKVRNTIFSENSIS